MCRNRFSDFAMYIGEFIVHMFIMAVEFAAGQEYSKSIRYHAYKTLQFTAVKNENFQ